MLQNLLAPEIEKIQDLIGKDQHVAVQFRDGIKDPCIEYCSILDEFVSWYFLARKQRHTDTTILQLESLGRSLQEKIKHTIPERTGKFSIDCQCVFKNYSFTNLFVGCIGSSLGWAFPKFHAIRHIPRLIVMYGCWENVSCQV